MVKASITGDIFEGLTTDPVPFASVRGYRPVVRQGLSLQLGGPFAFYRDFWPAHNLEHLSELVAPEVELPGGDTLHVPLLIHNDTSEPVEVTLRPDLPAGWRESAGTASYPVSAHDTYPVEAVVIAPAAQRISDWTALRWRAEVYDKAIGSVTMRVMLVGEYLGGMRRNFTCVSAEPESMAK